MEIYLQETEERSENEKTIKIPLKSPKLVITAKLRNLALSNTVHPTEYSVSPIFIIPAKF